jgi:segregation and condensation protein B
MAKKQDKSKSQSKRVPQPRSMRGKLSRPTDDGISLEHPAEINAMQDGPDPYQAENLTQHRWLDLETRPLSQSNQKFEVTPHRILEAMLFVGSAEGEPLESKRVASLMRGVRPDEIEDFVSDLNEEYARDGTPYRIIAEGSGFRMAYVESFNSVRNRFYGEVKDAELPQPVVDVLSLVAYRQPITREEVERLRGKKSAGLLSTLVRRNLLQIERTNTKPRQAFYRTTDRFLVLFNLNSLDDLPRSESDITE